MVRPFLWGLALVVVAAAAILLLLESDYFAGRARAELEIRLAAWLQRPVSVDELEVDLLPLTVELRGVRVGGASETAEPFFTARRLLVDAEFGSLIDRRFELDRLLAEEPVVRVNFDADGQHDAPRPRKRERRGRAPLPFDFAIGTVQIERGAAFLDHRRISLALAARDVRGRFVGVGELELRGRMTAEEVEVVLPRGRPYLGRVEVSAVVDREQLEIERAWVSGPHLIAEANGSWQFRGAREVVLAVEASARGELFDQLGYFAGQMRGPLLFAGAVQRRFGVWFYDGEVRSSRLAVFGRRIEDAEALVSGDRSELRIDIARARYGNGGLTGGLRIPVGRERGPIDLDLDLDAVDLDRLLIDQKIPVSGLAGLVSGDFNYQFAVGRADRGNGWADLVIRPARATAGLPVAGTAPLTIGGGVVATDAVRLTSEALELLLSGSYDVAARSGGFDLAVTAAELPRLVALLPGADLEGVAAAWRPVAGRGRVEARIDVAGSDAEAAITLDLLEVTAPGFTAATVNGRLTVGRESVEDLRLELSRPRGALIVSGSLPLEEAGGDPTAIDLAIDAVSWPLADVRAWLPFTTPIEGFFSGEVQLAGSFAELEGIVDGVLTAPSLGGVAGRELQLALEFDRQTVRFAEAHLAVAGGTVRVAGELDRATGGLDLGLASDALALGSEPLAAWSGELEGTVRARGEIGGSLDRPTAELTLEWSGLTADGAVVGDGLAATRLDWDGARLAVDGSIAGLVEISGGGPASPERVALELAVASDELGILARLHDPERVPEFTGAFAGTLTATGELRPAVALDIGLEIDSLEAAQEDTRLVNLEPVRARLKPGGLIIESFYLGQAQSSNEIFLAGEVALDGSGALDLNLQGALQSSWFEGWIPQVRLGGGMVEAIASVGGTLAAPRLDGVGELRQASMLIEDFPAAFEDVRATLLFYPRQIVVDSAEARVAGGHLRAQGNVQLAATLAEASYRLQFSGEDLSFRYPEGWLLRGGGEASLTSMDEGRQLTGAIRLDRAFYLRDVDLGVEQLLRSLFERRRLEVGRTDDLLATTQISLAVEADQALRIRNNLADLRGSADLVLRGTLASPVVFGTVDIDPGGELEYGGNDYEIRQGRLTFANPYRIEPIVDLVATTRLRDYEVTLNASGSVDRLAFDFASDPPLADLEVLSLLAGGAEPQFRGFTAARDPDSVGAESFLYGQATTVLTSRFNRLFGLDTFRIDPLTGASGDLSSARVTVGKQLSRDLFATLAYDPSQTEEQILELEWSVSRSLVLVLTQNGDGTFAVDARWEKRL